MQAIVVTIVNAFTRFFDFLIYLWKVFVGWIEYIWATTMQLLDVIFSVLVTIFVYGLEAVTSVLLFVFSLALALLPTMPDGPTVGGLNLGAANRYLPIAEVAALSGVWVAVFGLIGAYKFAKFVRGAG